jgi:hypothetical protein
MVKKTLQYYVKRYGGVLHGVGTRVGTKALMHVCKIGLKEKKRIFLLAPFVSPMVRLGTTQPNRTRDSQFVERKNVGQFGLTASPPLFATPPPSLPLTVNNSLEIKSYVLETFPHSV